MLSLFRAYDNIPHAKSFLHTSLCDKYFVNLAVGDFFEFSWNGSPFYQKAPGGNYVPRREYRKNPVNDAAAGEKHRTMPGNGM